MAVTLGATAVVTSSATHVGVVKSFEALSLNLASSGNSANAIEHTRTSMMKALKTWLLKWLIPTCTTPAIALKKRKLHCPVWWNIRKNWVALIILWRIASIFLFGASAAFGDVGHRRVPVDLRRRWPKNSASD